MGPGQGRRAWVRGPRACVQCACVQCLHGQSENSGCIMDRIMSRLMGCNTGRLVGRLMGCNIGRLMGRIMGCNTGRLMGRIMGCNIGRLMGRIMGCNTGRLMGRRTAPECSPSLLERALASGVQASCLVHPCPHLRALAWQASACSKGISGCGRADHLVPTGLACARAAYCSAAAALALWADQVHLPLAFAGGASTNAAPLTPLPLVPACRRSCRCSTRSRRTGCAAARCPRTPSSTACSWRRTRWWCSVHTSPPLGSTIGV